MYEDVQAVWVREVPDATAGGGDRRPGAEHLQRPLRQRSAHARRADRASPGLVFGHEPLGVVEQVGSAVQLGSAVQTVQPTCGWVIPTHLFCGACAMCSRVLSAACLRARARG